MPRRPAHTAPAFAPLARTPSIAQKEGREDQGKEKELGGNPPSCFKVPLVLLACLLALPWAPWKSEKGVFL